MKKLLSITLLMVVFLVQCNLEEKEKEKQDDRVRIIYPSWTEGIALTSLIEVILTDRLHYSVITKMDEIDSVFSAVALGDYDFFADAWLPHTHRNYWMEHKDSLIDLGMVFKNARTGIVVPEYMEIDSISQIAQLPVNQKIIYGIDAFAGIMQSTKKAVDHYNTGLEVVEENEAEMLRRLEEAYRKRQNIMITGWEPHWMFNRYDLKFLEDPDTIYGGTENIHILGRKGIKEDYPTLSIFLERISLTDKQMNSLINEINATEGLPERGAKNWINDNITTVNSWIHGLRVKRRYSE
ncbi:MAG: glycine betaine ABC transporter substrate-binding protein [bacterium]